MRENARVLVVDDEEVVRRSYSAILSANRCDAQTALDGAEALRAMEALPYDVVLLDLRMPGEDGISVLRQMKQKWPEAEVVIITGYPTVDTAKEAVKLGAYDYLAKPVGPEDVVAATLGALLRKRYALRQKMAN